MKSVYLDGKMSSLLDFQKGRKEALQKIAKGEKILFELDMGLFKGLTYPFGNEMETKSMLLAIEHFMNTLWQEFHPYAEGVVFYRGPLDFDKELFSEFLKCLTTKMSASVPLFLWFETAGESPLEVARKTAKSLFSRFEIVIDGKEPPFHSPCSHVGFLLPSQFDWVFQALLEKAILPRIVEESFLIGEWQGLDYLLVDPSFLDKEAVRKLKGFAAAGGVVVSLSEKIGVENEISFDREFLFPHL